LSIAVEERGRITRESDFGSSRHERQPGAGADNGSTSGPITITFTDGTSTTETLSSSDWAGGPGTNETAVATMSYAT
jgi:hypothetical protein